MVRPVSIISVRNFYYYERFHKCMEIIAFEGRSRKLLWIIFKWKYCGLVNIQLNIKSLITTNKIHWNWSFNIYLQDYLLIWNPVPYRQITSCAYDLNCSITFLFVLILLLFTFCIDSCLLEKTDPSLFWRFHEGSVQQITVPISLLIPIC